MNYYLNIKKTHFYLVCLFLCSFSCKKDASKDYEALSALELLNQTYKSHLNLSTVYLDSLMNANSKSDVLKFYKASRTQFKYAEPILGFSDKDNYKALNAPNILKVEEEDATDIKINQPFGYQVLEETIFEAPFSIEAVKLQAKKTKIRLGFVHQNTQLKLQDYHILWILREAIARVAFTGITGFDSPVLEASLEESAVVYKSLKHLLEIYKSNFKSLDLYEAFQNELDQSISNLESSNFEGFNRYDFIKKHSHKQLELINASKKDWNVNFPYNLAFNGSITSFFSEETFNMDFFSDYKQEDSVKTATIALGKMLFNDKNLSSNGTMSCATCHINEKSFTDGRVVFKNQKRNTPTLTYAALQQRFFYDGRTGNLEGQIVDVVNNTNEFHSNLKDLVSVVKKDVNYNKLFDSIYNGTVTDYNIRQSIAQYVRSLNTFNSKFDNNINNKQNDLSKSEINGFNLFMGKAKCATCHFAPVFNGTVPPDFTETEFELLGVPKDTLALTEIDSDLGRYDVFNTEERKYFFKTPTVRNVSKTSPYMHNGVYTTLEQVMTFYNNGGGAGLGLNLEYQTLPGDSLNLTDKEVKDVITFMKSLEDD
ncbi:cytochrome-c peroxidase [Aurantibacter aestuarii]|uniref:Methylamine utilization protein n=1 Tax=Aurantibacter aestuarii TaxID=1266046 RepID=A0A2T1N918_9FLAO|nr:cytochrome c peroxidase [Aurantibacter aestuarii]PSG88370.1 methylamine utilization protein [Aurantibacter aestuarii]